MFFFFFFVSTQMTMGRKPTTPTTVTASSTKSSQEACSLMSPVKSASKCAPCVIFFQEKNPWRPDCRFYEVWWSFSITALSSSTLTLYLSMPLLIKQLLTHLSLIILNQNLSALRWPFCLHHSHSAPSISVSHKHTHIHTHICTVCFSAATGNPF